MHPWPSDISPGVWIEITGNELDDFVSQVLVGVNVLQASENRNDFVATFPVERNLGDWATIKSSLAFVVLSHLEHSLKISG
jgi:hypothetical protein